MKKRISIDCLNLNLRGVDPVTAEAAVRLLGPALKAQFAQRHGPVNTAARIDAGRIAPASGPQALADRLAQRIAHSTQET